MKLSILALSALLIAPTLQAGPVRVTVDKVAIPTYAEPEREELPMFAENRVHQRTSGNPYPNKIVLKVNREQKSDKEYTLIRLENDYLELEILPELGGKIYAAKDKLNGYDFFYKNHVIKPALIGVLGSWTSGGLEFNWPFHHRASSFMPTDYEIEELDNGGVIVWISEHDPIDRMKGMVGIVLNPDESIFETRMKLSNRTPYRRSFLWWENVAVPCNENYEIFFPHDVSHVFFHYKRSVTSFPVATNAAGIFNGIRYNEPTDISKHKNTRQPTSYFSAASQYDFFGGYDAGLGSGVVHIGDHHVSPGKKMFTWAYNQLSQSWENALTDTDGPYCELMAGSYSDNQPNFSWLEPMETKCFSQYWFPIAEVGVPDFANTTGALYAKDAYRLQLNRPAIVTVSVTNANGSEAYSGKATLKARQTFSLPADVKPTMGQSVRVADEAGRPLMDYTIKSYDTFNIPHTTVDLPNIGTEESPTRLYQEGVHVDQYRDPAVKGTAYYQEAIKRDPNYSPALLALGEAALRNVSYDDALGYLLRAEQALTQFNNRPESGKLYYLMGQAYLGQGDTDRGYDNLQKAAWNRDYASPAMTYIGIIDIARTDWANAERHLATALRYQADNEQAIALASYLPALQGNKEEAARRFTALNNGDKLNHLARFFAVRTGQLSDADFWAPVLSDKNQLALDLLETLLAANLTDDAQALIASLEAQTPLVYSVSAIQADLTGGKPNASATEGIAFPSRPIELAAISNQADKGDAKAKSLLACALYAKGHYDDAVVLWSEVASKDYRASRNLAVAYYTHLNRRDEVLPLLKQALTLSPGNEQLIYETVYVMGKLDVDPKERIAFLEKNRRAITRDDVNLEWARAYNMAGQEDKALDLVKNRNFVPAEGGEHAVAEQYMMAYFLKGRKLMKESRWSEAAQCFADAQTLPQNLGAGLWNSARLVPYKYYEAICQKQLGNSAKAQENFDFITGLEVDYFTNMHLPELPVYQALCYREEGNPLKGDMLVNYKVQDWKAGLKAADAGYFGTTPFFISYVDAPEHARTAYFGYLLALANRYMGNDAAAQDYINQAAEADPYALNIFAERTLP